MDDHDLPEATTPSQSVVSSRLDRLSWRTRTLVVGGIIGTIVGLISAYLYLRAAEETYGEEAPEGPQTGDAVRLGISMLGIIRTITEWARRQP